MIVSGTGFVAGDGLGCQFGRTDVPGIFVTSTSVVCYSAQHNAGKVQLQITMDGADFTGDSLVFEYLHDIQIAGVQPSTGRTSGGQSTTVLGGSFDERLSLMCVFGTVEVGATFVNDMSLECTAPAVRGAQLVMLSSVDTNTETFLKTGSFLLYSAQYVLQKIVLFGSMRDTCSMSRPIQHVH